MPRYEFQCNHCEETFEVTMSIKEKESAQILCSKCQSSDLERLYNGININTGKTVKSSPGGCDGGQCYCG